MLKDLAEVWRFRELLLNLVVRDIRVRYKNSVLGFVWSFILPLAQVAVLTFVFRYLLQNDIKNFSAYLLCGILPFNFFNQSVLEASSSILGHAGLVKKTYFPREILPLSVVISNFVHFVFAMVVFILYLLFLRFVVFHDGHPLILMSWTLLPVVMIINFFLSAGIALFLAALNTFYEDVRYIVMVILSMLFYALPILYPYELATEVPHKRLGLLLDIHFMGNPLAYLMVIYRKIMLEPSPLIVKGVEIKNLPINPELFGLATLLSVLIFIGGYWYFNRRKWSFAERI